MNVTIYVLIDSGLESKVDKALTMLEKLMSVSAEIKQLTQQIDAATNDVAGRIDRLSQGVKNSMTDAEVAEVKAGLAAEVIRLTALGKDPENPVPTP